MIRYKPLLFSLMAASFISGLSSCSKSSNNNPGNGGGGGGTTPSVIEVVYRRNDKSTDINELWVVSSDGKTKQKINITPPDGWLIGNEDMAEVSPDKKSIVFLVYKELPTQQMAIYKCNSDGSNVQPVLAAENNGLAIQGFVTPKIILYWKSVDYNLELWEVGTSGENDHQLAITLPSNTSFGDQELAKVTSDGSTIVFLTQDNSTGAAAIYKCDATGKNVTLVSAESAGYDLAIQDISLDKSVLYRRENSTTFVNELWSVDLDGSNKHQINIQVPAGQELQNEEMAKALNDGTLVFSTDNPATNQSSIYSCAADGSNVKLITTDNSEYDIAIQSAFQQ